MLRKSFFTIMVVTCSCFHAFTQHLLLQPDRIFGMLLACIQRDYPAVDSVQAIEELWRDKRTHIERTVKPRQNRKRSDGNRRKFDGK